MLIRLGFKAKPIMRKQRSQVLKKGPLTGNLRISPINGINLQECKEPLTLLRSTHLP